MSSRKRKTSDDEHDGPSQPPSMVYHPPSLLNSETRPEPTTFKSEPTQTQLDDFSLSGGSVGLEAVVGEKVLSQLQILNTNLCKQFDIIHSRLDELGEKVDLLGRRIETDEDSSFRLTRVETVEEFNSSELQLKDQEKFQLLVTRLGEIGSQGTLGRLLRKYISATISPTVYKLYSMESKPKNGVVKLKFKDTLLYQALKVAAGKQFDLAKENKSFDTCLGEILRQANRAIKRINSKNIKNEKFDESDNDE